MSRPSPLAIIACIGAFLALCVAAAVSPWPAPFAGVPGIESDLIDKVDDRLVAVGAPEAVVTASGQDVTVELTGGLPEGLDRAALVRTLEAEAGVRSVSLIEAASSAPADGADNDPGDGEQDGTIDSAGADDSDADGSGSAGVDDAAPGAESTSFTATLADGAVALDGTVGTEEGRSTLVRAAQILAGDPALVTDQLHVYGGDGSDLEVIAAAEPAIRRLSEWFDQGVVEFGDGQLTIDGVAHSETDATRAGQVIEQLANRVGVEGSVSATVAEPPVPDDPDESDADAGDADAGDADAGDADAGASDDGEVSDDDQSAAPNPTEVVGGLDLSDIEFEADSVNLVPESLGVLDMIAATLAELGPVSIEVQGHTANVGDPDVNLLLSEDRARAVRDYLVAQGASDASLVARGYGSSIPIADNSTETGRAANDRISLVVIEGTN